VRFYQLNLFRCLEELTAEQIAGTRKKKKKRELKSEDFLKKRAFGSKPEYEALRVVQNYNGANTVYRGTRILRRLGPQGQTPLAQTGVPPWIGPCYYPNRTADKLYTHVVPYHSSFKATEREKKTIHDIRKEIGIRKEWSGLAKVHEELGLTSTPYSSPQGSPSRSRNMNQTSDELLESNMWSKSSAVSTLGAKNMTNHFASPPTPILGSRTVQKAIYLAKQKKGVIHLGDDDSSTSSIIAAPYDIERTRIFDERVLASSSVAGDGSSYFPDDGSASHGPDTVSLLSRSTNLRDFTGFSVDSVMTKAVKAHQMKRPLPDYTLGALSLYDESTTEELHFSTELPALKKGSGAHRPRGGSEDSSELGKDHLVTDSAAEMAEDASAAGSEVEEHNKGKKTAEPVNRRRRSVLSAINLNPMEVNKSKAIVGNARSAAKQAVAAEKEAGGGPAVQLPPAATRFRRNALRPTATEAPDVVGLLLRGKSQVMPIDTGDHENLAVELSKKTTMLSRSKSGIEMTLSGPGSCSFSEKRRAKKDEGETIKKFTSRSMSNLSFSEMKVLMTGDSTIDLNGLLLPGPAVDTDGSASLYEPPDTPRLQRKGRGEQHEDDDSDQEEEDFFFD
jgi:hypothetical protein